jgi:tetratricopeptide (TPR) repeat protein
LLLLAACHSSEGPATPQPNILHYEMTLRLDPAAHKMAVDGILTLPPERTVASNLNLRISHAAGDIEWSSLTPGVKVSAERQGVGANSRTANPSLKGARTIWTLSGDWRPRTPVRIKFKYELATREPEGFLYIGPEIAFGAGGWYPAIGGAKVTSSLQIEAPRGSAIASSGAPEGPPTSSSGFTSRRFRSEVPGDLLFAVSPPGSPTLDISSKLKLTTLRPRPTDSGWRLGLEGVQKALEDEFGPLPYPHVTVIEVPDAIAEKAGFGAFASPGAVLARSQFIDQPFNVAAFAHEFTHLWWGNHVGLQGRMGDFLLDEGLAQYGSMVAVDGVLGAAAGERYRRRGIAGFNEGVYSALGYLKINAAGFDRPLLALQDDDLSYWIAYSKAGLAWYALAEEMGRPNFRAALREIATAHSAGYVTWDAFVARLQRRSRRPLAPFIQAWFGAPDAPAYEIEWRQEGQAVSGRIFQRGATKPATLEVEANFADGTKARHRVRVTAEATEFQLPATGPVRRVVLDPDYKILRWTADLRAEATTMAADMRALVLARLDRKEEAEKVLLALVSQDPADNRYDRLLLARATLSRLAEERGCASCALGHIEAALSLKPTGLEPLAPTYLALALRARRLKRSDLAARAAQFALAGDALVRNANGVAAKLAAPEAAP